MIMESLHGEAVDELADSELADELESLLGSISISQSVLD